jgi:hypothetical protein
VRGLQLSPSVLPKGRKEGRKEEREEGEKKMKIKKRSMNETCKTSGTLQIISIK